MKYFSLFSGIGGFELGIDNRMECVGYSEIDYYTEAIYLKHFPEHKGYGNATEIKTKRIKDFDFLVAGFPCQSFSTAGNNKGFQDSRGTLFFEVIRILKDKLPRYFLLENVANLLGHESGQTFQRIVKELTDNGYVLQWEILNSKNFGLPQNRQRIYIVGHLRGEARPNVFPIRSKNPVFEAKIEEVSKGKGIAYCLEANYFKGPANQARTFIKSENTVRKLTPVECERLQGFPDNWTQYGTFGSNERLISNTQRWHCLGNAVSVSVVKKIIDKMLK